MHAPFAYFGGKTRLAARIAAAFPPHELLSGYDSPLYEELYGGWHSMRIDTTTGQGGARQERTEVLWSNRATAPTLFDCALDAPATPEAC